MAKVELHRQEAETPTLMPELCMRCGEPAMTHVFKKFFWSPPWIAIFFLFGGPLVVIILAVVLGKRMSVNTPFCAAHESHWRWRTWFTWISLIVLLVLGGGAFALLIATEQPGGPPNDLGGFVCLGGVLAFLAWLITIVVLQNTAIHTTKIDDEYITLTGVSQTFADALEDMRDKEEEPERPRR